MKIFDDVFGKKGIVDTAMSYGYFGPIIDPLVNKERYVKEGKDYSYNNVAMTGGQPEGVGMGSSAYSKYNEEEIKVDNPDQLTGFGKATKAVGSGLQMAGAVLTATGVGAPIGMAMTGAGAVMNTGVDLVDPNVSNGQKVSSAFNSIVNIGMMGSNMKTNKIAEASAPTVNTQTVQDLSNYKAQGIGINDLMYPMQEQDGFIPGQNSNISTPPILNETAPIINTGNSRNYKVPSTNSLINLNFEEENSISKMKSLVPKQNKYQFIPNRQQHINRSNDIYNNIQYNIPIAEKGMVVGAMPDKLEEKGSQYAQMFIQNALMNQRPNGNYNKEIIEQLNKQMEMISKPVEIKITQPEQSPVIATQPANETQVNAPVSELHQANLNRFNTDLSEITTLLQNELNKEKGSTFSYVVKINNTYRPFEQQQEFKKDRVKYPQVADFSWHQLGLGADVNIYMKDNKTGKLTKGAPQKAYAMYHKLAKEKGYESGIPNDPYHMEWAGSIEDYIKTNGLEGNEEWQKYLKTLKN